MPGEKVPSLTVALLVFFLNLPFTFRLGRASALAQRMTRSVFLTKYFFFHFSKKNIFPGSLHMHLHLQQLTCICQDIETDLNLYRIGILWMSFVF